MPSSKNKYGYHSCVDCGKVRYIRINGGKPTSIRCRSCANRKINTKHSGYGTRLYNIWSGIKQRCLNPRSELYKWYGGRGITVCDNWLKFVPFRDWALLSGYSDSLTIDRVNNDGNYEPTNCQWISSRDNLAKSVKQRVYHRETDRRATTSRENAIKMGLSNRTLTSTQINKIHELSNIGLSRKSIADTLNISYYIVCSTIAGRRNKCLYM